MTKVTWLQQRHRGLGSQKGLQIWAHDQRQRQSKEDDGGIGPGNKEDGNPTGAGDEGDNGKK